jgi:hypothetical protein
MGFILGQLEYGCSVRAQVAHAMISPALLSLPFRDSAACRFKLPLETLPGAGITRHMNIPTTFQSKLPPSVPSLVSSHTPPTEPRLAPLTIEDITGDIEHIIAKVIWPYADPTSFALNADDLRAECRAKLARIISAGHLAKCPTRAKAFAFVKVAFRNHVRSLVEKNAFSIKRTGHKSGPSESVETVRKPCHVRLDDPETDFQLGKEDISVRQREFLEELFDGLSPLEIAVLNDLISDNVNPSNAPIAGDMMKERKRSHVTESVRNARTSLLKKSRAILADCGGRYD